METERRRQAQKAKVGDGHSYGLKEEGSAC